MWCQEPRVSVFVGPQRGNTGAVALNFDASPGETLVELFKADGGMSPHDPHLPASAIAESPHGLCKSQSLGLIPLCIAYRVTSDSCPERGYVIIAF